MKPYFYKAVDYAFLYVLELIERVNSGDQVDGEVERQEICRLISDAESKLARNHAKDWNCAKYAIVAWIDEVLAGDLWPENPLEFEIFRSGRRASLFYGKKKGEDLEYSAQYAIKEHLPDALECYYIAVVLGFRGMYYSPDALAAGKELLDFDPPDSLEDWARGVADKIQIANDVPKISGIPQPLPGAHPRDGKFECIAAWLMAAILAIIVFFLLYW